MSRVTLTRRRIWMLLAIIFACLISAGVAERLAHSAEEKGGGGAPEERAADERDAAIESASFARSEFFGPQALVPYPTAEARNRLAGLLERYPDEPQIYLRLSQLDEKLGRFAESEQELQRFAEL